MTIDLSRPDIKMFYSRIMQVDGHWLIGGVPKLDGHRGGARICWYLAHGTFGEPLKGQVENDCGFAGCCNPAHQRFVPYRSGGAKMSERQKRVKKIRLLRERGWKNRDIADECGCSMGIVRRALKDV